MLIAVGSLTTMGLILGALLGVAARFLAVKENPLEEELKEMLPGSQCGQCGYVGCSQYAAALAKKLGVTADTSGHEEKVPEHAFIVENLCIGCTRCIRECSTDAIMGGNKLMHTIIIDACHGCGKCVPVCPTDAIIMVPVRVTLRNWHWPKPEIESAQPKHEVAHA